MGTFVEARPESPSANQSRGAVWIVLPSLVVLLAAALRFVELNDIPPGLYYDESANGVDALKVIAGWHPVFFPGDQGREPLVIYLQAATMALIGPSPMALRLPSAMLGVLTIAATYATFRAFAGRAVGLVGASLLAVSFWHVMLSRHAFRTDSLPLFTTLAAFWLYKGLRSGSLLAFALGGASLGVSLYTYIPARLAPPLFLLWAAGCVLVPSWRPKLSARRILGGAVLGGIVGTLVVLPLAWYFFQHPQDFIGRIQNASVHAPNQTVLDGLQGAFSALIVNGDPNPRHDLVGRPLLDVAVTIAGVVGIGLAARRWRNSSYIFAFAWCLAMVFPAALSYEPAHALRLVGELPFLLIFPALALAAVEHARPFARVLAGPVFVVFLLAASTVATVRDYFVIWAHRADTYDVFLSDQLHPLGLLSRVPDDSSVLATVDVYEGVVVPASFVPWAKGRVRAFDGLNTFVTPVEAASPVYYLYSRTHTAPTGAPLATRLSPFATSNDPYGRLDGALFRVASPYITLPADREVGAVIGSSVAITGADLTNVVRAGDTRSFALHWTVQGKLPPGNWEPFAHLVERNQHRLLVAGYNNGFLPSQWRTGDRVVSWFDLLVPPDTPAGVAEVNFGMIDPQTQQRLPITTPGGEPAGNVVIVGPVRIVRPEAPAPPPRYPLNVHFGSATTLLGYDVDKSDAGDSIIRLHWRADALMRSDFTVFVHLLDASGHFVVGSDSQPGDGQDPTSTWQIGETFVDDHRLSAAAPNATTVEIGLYLLSTGERLPAVDVDTGKPLGDAIRVPW